MATQTRLGRLNGTSTKLKPTCFIRASLVHDAHALMKLLTSRLEGTMRRGGGFFICSRLELVSH
jgi:hypothetical protein